jgi:hypothetical protein
VIRIAITEAAYGVIDRALPGAALRPAERNAAGKVIVWLDRTTVNRLERLRQPGEDVSDVIVRLAVGSSGTPA